MAMTVTIDAIAARQKLITEARVQVTFEGAFGDDLRIVNAARTSFGKRSVHEFRCETCNLTNMQLKANHDAGQPDPSHVHNYARVLSSADAGLISYLMRERHGTPFEM